MLKKALAVFGVAMALTWSPSAQDAKAVIANASAAIGVGTLKTVQYSATGYDFVLGQAPNPASAWPKFTEKSYTRSINFETPASKVDRVRAQLLNPPRGGGQQPIAEQTQSQTVIVAADTPWVQQLEIWMMPHGFLRAAATRNATVAAKTVAGKKYSVVTFTGDNNAKVSGYINAQNLVERVETQIDNPFFGDMPFEAIYSDYKDIGGAQFPMHIVQTQAGYPIFDLTLTDVKANAAISIQPAAGRGGAPAGAAPAAAAAPTPSEKLGDGVYLITGGYAVVAVDFKDYIAIVESGQTEARGLAVIAEAKRLIPNKPVKYSINTHSHIDHSSGLRAFVAEGSTILTHQVNKAYLEKVLSQPHTLNPDAAQKNGKKPAVEAFGDKKVLTDGTHSIEIYHQQNFGHHDGMALVYFPKEKVLIEADGYNPVAATATPPNPPSPYTQNLYENIQRLKLDVQRVVPVHYPADNRVVTMVELARWAGASSSTR